MRILHIYKSYYPDTLGGVESFITTLTQGLRQRGIESDLVVTTSGKRREINHVHYFPANLTLASTPFSVPYIRQFKSLTNHYDILHYHFPWPFADLTHLLSNIEKPTVLTYHADVTKQKYLNYLYTPVMYAFLKRVDRIIATSPNYAKTSKVLQKFQQKVSVIPFGMSRADLPTPSATLLESWRSRVGENFFLFVGVLRYYKGLDYLLSAVENTNIPLVIAGSGPEEKKLKALAIQKNLSQVHFLGHVNDEEKSALYQLCRAVVAPSHLRSEAFCLSLLEGLLFEKPLISTEIGTGTSFVNKHDVTGIVVPPANPIALNQAMLTLQQETSYYQQLLQSLRVYYQENFTADTMVNAYKDIYESLFHTTR